MTVLDAFGIGTVSQFCQASVLSGIDSFDCGGRHDYLSMVRHELHILPAQLLQLRWLSPPSTRDGAHPIRCQLARSTPNAPKGATTGCVAHHVQRCLGRL